MAANTPSTAAQGVFWSPRSAAVSSLTRGVLAAELSGAAAAAT
jgi:hypothetical protein